MDCEWRMRVICINMLAFQTIGISSGEQISPDSVLDYYCQRTSWKSHYHRTIIEHIYTHHRSSSHDCIQLGLYHLPLMTHVRDHWECGGMTSTRTCLCMHLSAGCMCVACCVLCTCELCMSCHVIMFFITAPCSRRTF